MVPDETYIEKNSPNDTLPYEVNILWHALRSRIQVRVFSHSSQQVIDQTILAGPAFEIPFKKHKVISSPVSIPSIPGNYTVQLRKLTTAQPYAPGLASDFLSASVFEFDSIELPKGMIIHNEIPELPTKLHFVGASDTAGYCVDGTPDMNIIQDGLEGWEYENCDMGYPGRLGRALNAQISV